MKSIADQSDGIVGLERKNVQLRDDVQRELASVSNRLSEIERSTQDTIANRNKRAPAAAALPGKDGLFLNVAHLY
jgi:hypothetical protein